MRTSLLCGLVLFAWGCENTAPRKPGNSWRHKELVEYLNSRGIGVILADAPHLSRAGRTAAFLIEPGDTTPGIVVFHCQDSREPPILTASFPEGEGFESGQFVFGLSPEATPAERKLFTQIRASLK